jgi:hypothetical protein
MSRKIPLFAAQQELEVKVDIDNIFELNELIRIGFQVLRNGANPNLYRINIPHGWSMQKYDSLRKKSYIIRDRKHLPIVEIEECVKDLDFEDSYTDIYINDIITATQMRELELKNIRRQKFLDMVRALMIHRTEYWNDQIKFALYLTKYVGEVKVDGVPAAKIIHSCQGLFEDEKQILPVIDHIEKYCGIKILDHLYYEPITYEEYEKKISKGPYKMKNIMLEAPLPDL